MRLARSKTPIIHAKDQEFKMGKGIVMRDGSDCTIVACGITVSIALEAADSLKQEGISCRVIDMFSIKPIDSELLEKAARETGGIVTCEEHNIMAGFGSAVAETVSETYPVLVKRVGAKDQFGESARDSEIPLLLEKHGITSVHISNTVKSIRSQIK
jgi:transketolase